MASTIASTLALSRPSEKLGTHSTRVDIRDKEYHREWERNVDMRVPHPCLSVFWRDRMGLLNGDYCLGTKSSSTAFPIRSGGSNPCAGLKPGNFFDFPLCPR